MSRRSAWLACWLWAVAVAVAGGCSSPGDMEVPVPGRAGAVKSSAEARAGRRAYDGAPPVIAHDDMGMACLSCHGAYGVSVEGVGFAPPSPHALTEGIGATGRCRQCHVYRSTDERFVESTYVGVRQRMRGGTRAHAYAPPVMPHPRFMREDCLACHGGPAAREEIRTSHPERARCAQCHVPARTAERFERAVDE